MGSKCPSHIWEDVDLDFFKIDEKVVGGGGAVVLTNQLISVISNCHVTLKFV